MTKKVIFIDWNKTLSNSLFWEHLKDSSHPNHMHLSSIEKWLFVDNRDYLNHWMRGQLSVAEIARIMSSDTGVDSKIIIHELRHSCEIMQYSINNLEEIVKTIQKQDIQVVIATDNMDTFSQYTIPSMKLDELFDDILNSYEIGHLKDDELPTDKIMFFDDYLKKKGWNYGDAVLLDDSPDKSGKYKKLGFERVLIDKPVTLQRELERFINAR